MQNSIKTLRTFKSALRELRLRSAIFLLAGICLAGSLHGQKPKDPCAPNEYPFIGVPAPNLCGQYGSLEYNVQVGSGSGTGINNSSQLGTSYSGYIWIKGTFYIDNNFSFVNSIVKLDPGSTILVLPPFSSTISKSFTIDNSKLFACAQMWNGIVLSNNTTIFTKNGTVIEDAIEAIKADNIQFSTLVIENTTFNRDGIGILLMQSPTLPKAATITRFRSNRFTCTSPLNGTADQITFAGVKTVNVPFTVSASVEAFNNRFEGIQNGIVAEGGNTTISGRFFRFFEIRKDGIFMNNGSLILTGSQFRNCEEKGVNVNLAQRVDIRGCSFTMNTNAPASSLPNYRTGVYIGGFALNSYAGMDITVNADLLGNSTPVRGVHLKGGNVGAGTHISVWQSDFSIGSESDVVCVFLDGAFPITSETHIYNNNFNVTSQLSGSIAIRSEGEKNNLNIYENNFGNYQNIGLMTGIYLNSSAGAENYIADNNFENFGTGGVLLSMGNFQNSTICSNEAGSINASTGFSFFGTNTGTDFLNNEIIATGIGVVISDNSFIEPQPHKGNTWNPLIETFGPFTVTWRALYHALCQTAGFAALNKFTVHTDQSIWIPDPVNQYSFFSEFHPESIVPDVNDEFFAVDPMGTPSTGCSVQLNGPGEGELYRAIADGLLPAPAGNPSMGWIANSFLYKKLKDNPSIVGNYASYATFLGTHANTNVGRFYEVGKKIELANTASSALSQQSSDIMDDIEDLLAAIETTDGQLEAATNAGTLASLSQAKSDQQDQLRGLQAGFDAVYASYETQKATKLQEALTLIQQITPNGQLESNERTVTEIYLLSVLNQSGTLTEAQVNQLRTIGEQCPEVGGLAVVAALTLLPDCKKAEMNICEPAALNLVAPTPHQSGGEKLLRTPQKGPGSAWVYPNPANSVLFINLPKHTASAQLSIADMSGKTVFMQELEGNSQEVELGPDILPGIYMVTILSDTGERHTEKLVIQSN